MSYPPPRHLGDSGEITAAYRRAGHAPGVQRATGIHGFKNTSGAPATMLLHFGPGAPREEYFERVPDMRDVTEEERAAFFLKHDTFWV